MDLKHLNFTSNATFLEAPRDSFLIPGSCFRSPAVFKYSQLAGAIGASAGLFISYPFSLMCRLNIAKKEITYIAFSIIGWVVGNILGIFKTCEYTHAVDQ